MTIQELVTRLIEYCHKQEWEKAQKELYADDAVSIEPYDTPGFPKETKGLTAIIEKGHKFKEMVDDMHDVTISDPLVTAGAIAFILTMDVTMKGREREKMSELCVYEVKDGKIVSEHFYM